MKNISIISYPAFVLSLLICIILGSDHLFPTENNPPETWLLNDNQGDFSLFKIIRYHQDIVTDLIFMDSHTLISSARDGNIIRCHLLEEECELLYEAQNPVYCLALDQENNRVYAGTRKGAVCIIPLLDNNPSQSIEIVQHHNYPVYDIVFHPEQFFYATASFDRSIAFFNRQNNQLLDQITLDYYPTCLSFTDDGKYLAWGSDDGKMRLINLHNGELVIRSYHANDIWDIEFIPLTHKLLSSSWDGKLMIWDIEHNTTSLCLSQQSFIWTLEYLDFHEVVLVGTDDGTLITYSPLSRDPIIAMELNHGITSIAAANRDQYIAVATKKGDIILYSSNPVE